jgi:hypothetical protein
MRGIQRAITNEDRYAPEVFDKDAMSKASR